MACDQRGGETVVRIYTAKSASRGGGLARAGTPEAERLRAIVEAVNQMSWMVKFSESAIRFESPPPVRQADRFS
jgi:hypothetical protein